MFTFSETLPSIVTLKISRPAGWKVLGQVIALRQTDSQITGEWICSAWPKVQQRDFLYQHQLIMSSRNIAGPSEVRALPLGISSGTLRLLFLEC